MKDSSRSPVRRFGEWAIILAVVAGVYAYMESGRQSALLGRPAPELNLWVVAGAEAGESARRVALSDLAGRVTVLDFWASWCSACRRATPMLNELESEFSRKGVSFFGVNVEPVDESVVASAHASFGMAFPVLHDRAAQVQRAYSVRLLPTVVVIGPNGLVSYFSAGAPSESRLRKEIAKASQETSR